MRLFLAFLMTLFLSGCLGMPEGVYPVEGFDINQYSGKWYEIARLDHSFERGLNNVTAQYYLRDDGVVKVINRGFSPAENKWKEAEGKAYFVKDPNVGYLKVSFFGPFYGSYVVFELDKENYQYAFVTSRSKSYLWFLSRSPTVSTELLDRFVKTSKGLGFNTENLIFVEHN
jgi:apolipoprotein D and lipocalin family protein